MEDGSEYLREGADGVVGVDAATVVIVDGHAFIAIGDIGNNRVQEESGIVWFQEC